MWVFLNDKLTIRFFQTSSCTTNASLYLEKYCPAFWLFYSFFCFFWFVALSFWETPDGHFKTSKKKDLNKRFLGRAIFRITRLFLVFLNVHLQYICLPPNYIAAASTLGREPMGKVRKTISIFGVSRRPEKNSILSATTWGNQPPPIVSENRTWLPPIYMGSMCATAHCNQHKKFFRRTKFTKCHR